jgi:hypothetical protein
MARNWFALMANVISSNALTTGIILNKTEVVMEGLFILPTNGPTLSRQVNEARSYLIVKNPNRLVWDEYATDRQMKMLLINFFLGADDAL